MKLKLGIFVSFLLFWGYGSFGQAYDPLPDQKAPKGFQKENLFFGGDIGLSFGSLTYLNVSPLIGYKFSNLFSAGAQINGLYESVRYRDFNGKTIEKDQFGMFGLGIFGRISPIQQFFIHLQPELNYGMGNTVDYTVEPRQKRKYRETEPAFLAGGGYSQPVSSNTSFVFMILYDVLQDDRSPYGNKAIFRIGANIGF